jgi:hypothetical protein
MRERKMASSSTIKTLDEITDIGVSKEGKSMVLPNSTNEVYQGPHFSNTAKKVFPG